MARINLLPWRVERRKQREREFYGLLGLSALCGLLVLALLIGWMVARINNQEARNQLLTDKIAQLDKRIVEIKELDKERSRLLTRKQIIEQLQANRSQMVHLFDELVRTIPDGVRLTSLKQVGEQMNLEGVAQSNSRVATYMRHLDASHWMGYSDLRKIENKSGEGDVRKTPYVFSLDVKLRKPEEVVPEDATGADPAAASANGVDAAGSGDTGNAAAQGATGEAGTPEPSSTPEASSPAAPAPDAGATQSREAQPAGGEPAANATPSVTDIPLPVVDTPVAAATTTGGTP